MGWILLPKGTVRFSSLGCYPVRSLFSGVSEWQRKKSCPCGRVKHWFPCMEPDFVLHPRHLPGFHASLIPSATPCFWVLSESPFTLSYFFMGSMMGELAGRWGKFREISMMGRWDMEQCGNMDIEQGDHGRGPQREGPKLWVRRP